MVFDIFNKSFLYHYINFHQLGSGGIHTIRCVGNQTEGGWSSTTPHYAQSFG